MNDDVKVIILKVDRGTNKPNGDTVLHGRSLVQWVSCSMRGMETESVNYTEGDDILSVIRPYLSEQRPITVVLFSDTPLITYTAVTNAVKQFLATKSSMLKLPRGWVLSTETARTATELIEDRTFTAVGEEFTVISTFNNFAYVSEIVRSRIACFFMNNGVQIIDPASTFIGVDAIIQEGAVIYPFVTISGKSVIKSGAVIKEHSVIESSVVESGAVIRASTLTGAVVGSGVTVGPYAHLRKGAFIDSNAKIGDYVEIKNSRIGKGSKVSHLAYVGDAIIGENVNVGAGVVFANYNGSVKRKTIVEDDVFIGSNATLVAPLNIGKGAFIAAGSVITEDVPSRALSITRPNQVIKPEWTKNTYTNNIE